ncbi:MAG: S8 family peptidase [Acidobacteria bacterium]|nr:S8 family peptidase [Acidobacteriota bacterium]
MASGSARRSRHFIIEGCTTTERYRSTWTPRRPAPVPERNRIRHGGALQEQLEAVRKEADVAREVQRAAGIEEDLGLRIEFESFPEIELAFESLARDRSGIELLNVRLLGDRTYATVFVPDGRLDHFERLIVDYMEEKRDRRGYARDNRRLVDAIRRIRAASLRALWTDVDSEFPTAEEGSLWWEVGLPVREDRKVVIASFRERAEAQEMRMAPGNLFFPERSVLLVSASLEQMQRSILTLNSIAELRRAKETAEFFGSLRPDEQQEWLAELLTRIHFPSGGNGVPHVCLLDTGVSRGHPLLSRALNGGDLHTVVPGWGVDDAHGHGTEMAGVALAGDLTPLLDGTAHVQLEHRLESVKLLPGPGGSGDPRHHGYVTVEAVARPEIAAPGRLRVFGMAVTARDDRERGRPSAWSAAVDSVAADVAGAGAYPRLLVLSAGNIQDPAAWLSYPVSNDTDGVHDPAQAWNALTVGAFTDRVRIAEPDSESYTPIAPRGGLSPFSTTSLTWEKQWPLKPDVVLEGGNAARDLLSAVTADSLSLLTTHHRPADRIFTTTCATSAAMALAARLAARIMVVYPRLWPETIRALIVHSAEWTGAMRKSSLPARGTPTKTHYRRLLRRCGFGVPDLARALWSVENSLTMVVEERLHPFEREGTNQPKLRDMHLHNLPWPRESLEALGDVEVEMRVTLSYFVEPNPSGRGVRSRYRYESHGLRFDVKRPHESVDEFRKRVNVAARDEEEGTPSGGDSDPAWLIGTQSRHRGSLHGDIWRGSAADLASRGCLAVYPAIGWWKTRQALERYDQPARYALVVGIRAPEVDVDLRAEVANRIGVPVETA